LFNLHCAVAFGILEDFPEMNESGKTGLPNK